LPANNKPKATNVVQKLVHVLATIIIGFRPNSHPHTWFFLSPCFAWDYLWWAVMVLLGCYLAGILLPFIRFFSVVIASPVMLFLAILGFVALIIIPLVYMVLYRH
jgi:hypothetical protein